MEPFLNYIDDKTVISKDIMPHYLSGFWDSCSEIQEETISNIHIIISHISSSEINDKFTNFLCGFLNSNLNLKNIKLLTIQFKQVIFYDY